MHLSIEEIADQLGMPTQRILNLLHMAGLQEKADTPKLHWELSPQGQKFHLNGKWSRDVIPLLLEQRERQEDRTSVRVTEVDKELCEKCLIEKPYYEFFYSQKRPGELTRWCKACHGISGG